LAYSFACGSQHICQRASALPVYNSILSAFRVRFIMSSHNVKHTDLSSSVPSDPTLILLYRQLRYPAIQPTPYPHTIQACPLTTLHVSRITVAQAISSANFVSRYQKPTLSNLPTASDSNCIRTSCMQMDRKLQTDLQHACRWTVSCRWTSSTQMDR